MYEERAEAAMSSNDEIRAVYADDIDKMDRVVFSHGGFVPFLSDSMTGFSFHHLYEGILSEEDLEFLSRILSNDSH